MTLKECNDLIQTQAAQHSPYSFSAQQNKRLMYLFCICLVISIMFHVVTLIGVITTNSPQKSGVAVSYIDLTDFTEPSHHNIPVMSAPVPPADQLEPVVQQPSTDPDDAINSSDKNSTAKAVPDILATPLGLGMANGFFSSLANGRTLREDIRGYYFDMLEKINHSWWQKAGTLAETAQQEGIIEIQIGRDGILLDVKQMRSSGSREVDLAIIDAINVAAPFPALPGSYEGNVFRAPLKISKPSNLFGVRNAR